MEIDLNENNITGTLKFDYPGSGISKLTSSSAVTVENLDVKTPAASFEQGANVTVTNLDLRDVAPKTYTNNGKITTANITDTNARFLNEGTATVGKLTVNTTGFVTLGGNAPLANVVVTQASSVDVLVGTFVSDLQVNAATTVNNAGTIADLTGSGTVTLAGSGEVETVTNENVTVEQSGTANQSLKKSGELSKSGEVYSASFNWSSENGIGSGSVSKHTSPGGYKYFGDGAYLDITVKKGENEYLTFNDVLASLTLQTKADGAVDSISGNATGRQAADWGKPDANHSGTKLTGNIPGKSVFYGVRQNNSNGVATVGFNAGEKRDINLTLTPKSDLGVGIYTVTIQPKQQESATVGNNLGEAITYTFEITE